MDIYGFAIIKHLLQELEERFFASVTESMLAIAVTEDFVFEVAAPVVLKFHALFKVRKITPTSTCAR